MSCAPRPWIHEQTRSLRCAGLLRDITAQKRSQERLLHNAIHDSLTGLPNRELFLDRTHCAIARAHEDGSKPTVLYIDIDTFQSLSRSTDFTVSDSMLLTISRRLARHLGRRTRLRASAASNSRCCSRPRPSRAISPCSPSGCAVRCARR